MIFLAQIFSESMNFQFIFPSLYLCYFYHESRDEQFFTFKQFHVSDATEENDCENSHGVKGKWENFHLNFDVAESRENENLTEKNLLSAV